jgi:hypothetical protein
MKAFFSAFALTGFLLLLPSTTFAESKPVSANAQADAFSALQELENSLLGALVWSTPIGGGKCRPKFSIGFFSLSLVYESSDTCPLLGKVAVGFFPLSADIDLDVNRLSNVNRIQMKAKISVKYAKGNGVNLGLYFTDGRIALRPGANAAITEMVLNGSVAMGFSKDNHSIKSRKNIFHPGTGAGFSLITDVSKQPQVRRFEGCVLMGGVADNVNAGLLTLCTPLFK